MYLIVYIKKHKCYQGKILELSISSTEQLLFPSTIRATRKIWVSYALKKKKKLYINLFEVDKQSNIP